MNPYKKVKKGLYLSILGTLAISTTATTQADSIDSTLRGLLAEQKVTSVTPPPAQDPDLVKLGQSLFFDKELAGTRNISCSTCHSPLMGSADGQSQSRAQGAVGLGPHRRIPDGDNQTEFLPRNALSLWNRGVEGFDVMFWDGRLSGSFEEGFTSPADPDTPQTFTNAFTAFTLFPVTADEEMRGFPGQLDSLGNENELADLTDEDFTFIWDALAARIVADDGYDELLANAFPEVPESKIDITHIAEAVGAFMTDAFTALNSPFDQYLAGNNDIMSTSQKRGAILFYGTAGCSGCHSGALQTDLDFHNIAAPQIGGGRSTFAPLDVGRGDITGNPEDHFKFRTPSLRNIELEAPYFHNGAFAELEDAVRHHVDPLASLKSYDPTQVAFELVDTFQNDSELINTLINTKSPLLRPRIQLTDPGIEDVMNFLSALTDQSSLNLLDLVPIAVPSGLPLND